MYVTHQNRVATRTLPVIDDAGLRRSGRIAREMPLKSGQTLFHQGDPAPHFYEVQRGGVRLERFLPNGRRQVMAFAFAGEIIGLSPDGVHLSTCRSITAASVIAHRRDSLDCGAVDSQLRGRALTAALGEIRLLHDRFQSLGRGSALQRLAGFLAQMAERLGARQGGSIVVQLPMCRADIADYLGLTTETVSRTFSQLRGLGVIALADVQKVLVTDPGQLGLLAEGE